jgi:type IV secretory pathway ATPase VirB11/archaellum biosynthesis ATPase
VARRTRRAELTLDDLVKNRTMSREMAATLGRTVQERRSYLVMALPRLAGKSTVGKAMLDQVTAGVPIRELGEDGTDVDELAEEARGGYLYVPEVSRHPVTEGYVWGAPVRRAFAAIQRGTALSTALHADAVTDAIDIIRANDVPDADLGRLEIVVHIRSLGDDWRTPTRRVVVGIHEIVDVSKGRSETRVLHRWDERTDRFESLS